MILKSHSSLRDMLPKAFEFKSKIVLTHIYAEHKDELAMTTLREVLRFLEDSSLMLNIELKPCREDGFEKEAVNLISEANMQNRCLIASSDCGILQRVKGYAPEIRTAYVGCDFKSCILQLRYADAISLNANCVDAKVVQLSHSAGKPIYVWTVNTKQMLDKVIALGVDGVITNNPALAIQRTYFVEKQPAAQE